MSFHLSHLFGGSGNFGQDVKKAGRLTGDLVSGGPASLLDNTKMNPGQKNDALFGGSSTYQAQQTRARQEAAQAEENARTDDLLARANANYGVGLTPEARANDARLSAEKTTGERDALATAKNTADTGYQSALTQQRADLARSGQIGSGTDAQQRSSLLAQYFGSMTDAQKAAQTAGQKFDTENNQNRLALRQGIQGGQITDATGLSTQIGGLNAQGSGSTLWANILGQGASAGANAFSNNQLAQAFGRPAAA